MTTTGTNNTQSRPNFFILLDLNPDANWSEATFNDALKEKRNKWARETTSIGAKALAAQKNIALIGEIKRVMTDENLRKVEAAQARIQQAAGQKDKLADFERQLGFINAKTSIEQKDLDKLINGFKDVLSPQEITARIKVPILANTAPTAGTAQAEQLDATIAKTIADLLQTLNMDTLYNFLESSDKTATAELRRKAEQINIEQGKRVPKTPEVTAKVELSGQAQIIFSSESSKRKYDETLRQRSLNELLKELDKTMSISSENIVEVGLVKYFLDEARKAGWSEQEARAKLLDYATRRKWLPQFPTIDPSVQTLRCGGCHTINDAKQSFCIKCREELYINCPDCGQRVSCENSACGNCGFPVGNRYLVDSYLAEAITLLKAGDTVGAQREIEEATQCWRPKKIDGRAQRIAEIKAKIEAEVQRVVQQRLEIVERIERLVKQKNFFAVQALLVSPEGAALFSKDRERYKQEAQSAIIRAQSLLQQAKTPSATQDSRVEYYRQTLTTVADYQEARELLKTMPPSAPSQLRFQLRGSVVSLAWSPSSTQRVAYSIVRKTRAQPNTAQDGKVLGTVTGTTYEDTTPEIGIPLYYAVYAEYEKVYSARAALLAIPVLLTQSIPKANIQVKVDDHQVDLSWDEVPANAEAVIVVRKERNAPTSIQDGIRIVELSNTQKRFIDRNVQNETLYYYAFFCTFRDAEGRTVTSEPTIVQAQPETPPAAIAQLDIQARQAGNGYEVTIRWIAPDKGQVVIIKSVQPLAGQGQIVAETQLSGLGQRLADRPDMLTDRWNNAGMAYYTPIVLFQNMAYVGKSQRYACVDTISNLRYQNLGSTIRLHWNWPARCDEVLVLSSMYNWPQANDPQTVMRRVSHTQYDHLGYHDIQGSNGANEYYISVVTLIREGREVIEAPEIRIHAHAIGSKIAFTYEIKNPYLLRKKRTLHIKARAAGSLPSLLLVSRRDRLPLNKNDGEIFYQLASTVVDEKELVVELPELTPMPRTYVKIFLEDDSLYEAVNIYHPSTEKLRLS